MERLIKVQKQFQRGQMKKFVAVPEIKLKGKWLKKAGFETDSKVKIQIKGDKIIIKTA